MLKLYNLKALWLVLFILCTAVLTAVALVPDSSMVIIDTGTDFRWDYLEHLLAYFVFGSLYILWRSNNKFLLKGVDVVILVAITCALSLISEYAQLLIPERTFNIYDMLFNLLGVFAGLLIIYLLLIRVYLRMKYTH
jgi:VanZ family protein